MTPSSLTAHDRPETFVQINPLPAFLLLIQKWASVLVKGGQEVCVIGVANVSAGRQVGVGLGLLGLPFWESKTTSDRKERQKLV